MPRNECWRNLSDNRIREGELREGMVLENNSTYAIVTKNLDVVDLDDGRVVTKEQVEDCGYMRVPKGTVLRLTVKV